MSVSANAIQFQAGSGVTGFDARFDRRGEEKMAVRAAGFLPVAPTADVNLFI